MDRMYNTAKNLRRFVEPFFANRIIQVSFISTYITTATCKYVP